MTAVCISPLRSAPIPDARPAPIRWRQPEPAYAGMVPLPLDPADLPGPVPIAVSPDPELELFATALLRALLDTVQGRRPVAQLTRWVDDEVYADLCLRARLHQRQPVALALRTFRLQQVSEGAVEVSARVQAGPRYAAVALRLERMGSRWVCRIADFGPLAAGPEDPLPRLRDHGGVRAGRAQRRV